MELKSVLLVYVVISVANLLEAQATNGTLLETKREQNAKFMRHRKLLIKEGTCEPKIRLAYLSDHPDADPGVVYDPPAAVLHLCDSTGSCCFENARYQCKPTEEENVEVVFSARPFGERQAKFKAFTFHNHTRCACMDIGELPR